MRLRPFLTILAACSSSPRPAPPPLEIAAGPSDAAPAIADEPPAPVDAPTVAVDAPIDDDEPEAATPLVAKHWGPPPRPPQSLRWSLHVPAFGKHGSTSESLEVEHDGRGSYGRSGSGKSEGGMVDPGPVIRCDGRVEPKLHAALVAAARKVVSVACLKDKAPRRGMPSLSMSYVYGRATKDCRIDRDHATYPAYARLHDQVVDALCKP